MSGFKNNHFGTHVVLVVRKYGRFEFSPPLSPPFQCCWVLVIAYPTSARMVLFLSRPDTDKTSCNSEVGG